MIKSKWLMAAMAAVIAVGLVAGCSDSDDDKGGGGSYAGNWTGQSCGRGMTMRISQNGSTLSGTYAFSDPVFNDTFSGTVSSTTPPGKAILRSTGGHDFWFDVTFTSENAFSGGYYKSGVKVCNVNAAK